MSKKKSPTVIDFSTVEEFGEVEEAVESTIRTSKRLRAKHVDMSSALSIALGDSREAMRKKASAAAKKAKEQSLKPQEMLNVLNGAKDGRDVVILFHDTMKSRKQLSRWNQYLVKYIRTLETETIADVLRIMVECWPEYCLSRSNYRNLDRTRLDVNAFLDSYKFLAHYMEFLAKQVKAGAYVESGASARIQEGKEGSEIVYI